MRLYIPVLLLFFSVIVVGQEKFSDHELIIQSSNTPAEVYRQLNSIENIRTYKLISASQNAFLVSFEKQYFEEIEERLFNQDWINHVQRNYYVEQRFIPNDQLYSSQWALERIEADKMWDLTTGGTTYDGKEIVVAILDDGFQINHEDLEDQMWVNKGEVANNNIDDDGNGYIDDYLGWNFDDLNDQHESLVHGTAVAGIIGAEGDNLDGISGVNHKVKLMYLSRVNALSEIIEAYEYVIDQRLAFNNSDGEQGAYVVATNFSAGVPNQFGSDFPIWCNLYNTLGALGVLSVSSATNDEIDVDINGDLPTTCSSQFLITVTNSDINEALDGGYSDVNVDIAAPGDAILTTDINNAYNSFPGTSASAPHVAGAVALLHALPCDGLVEAIQANQAGVALSIKEAIMSGSTKFTDFESTTVSGGRLNLFESLKLAQMICGGSSGDLRIINAPLGSSINSRFIYETPDFGIYEFLVFDAMGRLIYEEDIIPVLSGEKAFEIENHDWPTGIYFYSFHNENESVSGKFFKP